MAQSKASYTAYPEPVHNGISETSAALETGSFTVPQRSFLTWLLAAATLVFTTALAIMLRPILDGQVSSGLIFVLGIMVVGVIAGLIPALLSAIMAAIAFNLLISDPPFIFRVSNGDDLAPAFIFAACASISGALSGKLRDRTIALGHSNLQLEGLFETSRLLQSAADLDTISEILEERTARLFGLKINLFVVEKTGLVSARETALSESTIRIASLCLRDSECVREDDLIACRLDGIESIAGAIVVQLPDRANPDSGFVPALAGLVALAVERAQLSSFVAQTAAEARTTQMKSALLASVSHDLRTPLTAISAAASGLVEYRELIDEETSNQLLTTIVSE